MDECRARTHRGTICKKPPVRPGGRCRWHGGASTGPRNHVGFHAATRAGWRRKLELRHALGLPFPWGRRKKNYAQTVDQMASDAVKQGELALAAIETLPPLEQMEGRASEAGEQLLVGMKAGLAAGTDICQAYLRARAQDPDGPIDMKLANLASMTGGWMCRLGMRAMEEVFRQKREDRIGQLLAALNEDAKKSD